MDVDVLKRTCDGHVTGRALTFVQTLTSTSIPTVQNRQSYNLKNSIENYTTFPGQTVTLVLYHPPINAEQIPSEKGKKKKKRKLHNQYWLVRCAERRKCLAFIQHRGSDSSQAQHSKHASTGLPLSSNTKPFRIVPMTFQQWKVLHRGDLWMSVCWYKMERNTPN